MIIYDSTPHFAGYQSFIVRNQSQIAGNQSHILLEPFTIFKESVTDSKITRNFLLYVCLVKKNTQKVDARSLLESIVKCQTLIVICIIPYCYFMTPSTPLSRLQSFIKTTDASLYCSYQPECITFPSVYLIISQTRDEFS
jgi:hypothetical protein